MSESQVLLAKPRYFIHILKITVIKFFKIPVFSDVLQGRSSWRRGQIFVRNIDTIL
jgi:hypothetical protein